jgi:anti-anti-sigma factor
MRHFHCTTETLPDGIIVRTAGDVDLATGPLLANALTAAFGAHRHVILDLHAVPYIDSAGLHVLARTAARHVGRFVVVQSTPRLRRLLDIIEMAGLVPVVPSVAEAQQYLNEHNGPVPAPRSIAEPAVGDESE